MKFGFICPQVPGHLNPITALARHLQMRKHDVVFLYSSGAAGLPFIPGEEEDIISERRAELSKKQGDEALKFSMGLIMSQAESIVKSLPNIVQSNQIDALVIDCVNFYAELGAIQLGIPYIHVSAAMHFDYSGHTPLLFYGWHHETTAAALARNQDGVAKFLQMVHEANGGIRAHAEAAGLKIDWDNPCSTLSPWASISQVPKAFDFESSHWPSQFHHTGPFHDGQGRESVDFPWEQITGEPLIYASMGTILNGRADVFRTIIAALDKNRDLQLVLSIGDQIDPQQLGPAPKNAIVVKRAPQLELLKRASVCITHGGLNTVLESLARGVPQVAIPVAYDQPGVAARIAHHRTGVVTSLDKLTADHLSTLLNEVLDNSAYRNNAHKLQRAIAEANGLSVAVDIIEQSVGINRNSLPSPAQNQKALTKRRQMNKLDSAIVENKESTCQVSHPTIGKIYCLNASEARATLHEICDDRLYLQAGVSISAGDVVLDIGANIGVFTLFAAEQGAQVYAYEPMPPTYAVLLHNVTAHGLDQVVRTQNIGLSDRAEEKMMFHYPKASVCDSWTAQDSLFEYLAENWEHALEMFATADPNEFAAISALDSRAEQQAAVRQRIKDLSASTVQIKCKFDTLSSVIAQERIEFIDLLKLDAELADWEILNGITDKDWQRIRQLAMEVHVASDVEPISQFLKDRGFGHVAGSELKMGTGCIWAIK